MRLNTFSCESQPSVCLLWYLYFVRGNSYLLTPLREAQREGIYIYTHTATAKSLQLCPTLCDPIDGSQPGSLVPGIPQARTLEWVAISFSNAWKWKVKVKSLSRVQLSDPRLQPTRLLSPWDFPGKSTEVGCHCLLRCIYIHMANSCCCAAGKPTQDCKAIILQFKNIRKIAMRIRRNYEIVLVIWRLSSSSQSI